MSEEVKPFSWAFDDKANLQEPIEALKQHGWRYSDVPAASNFNWMFKKISDEFGDLKKELLAQRIENQKNQELLKAVTDEVFLLGSSLKQTNEKLSTANSELASHKTDIEHNRAEIATAKNNHESLKTSTKTRFDRTFRNDDFNNGISRQICMLLRAMEDMLQYYHPGFPKQPWPMQEHTSVEINENDATNSPT